jgi:hypothetical protein
LHTQNKNRITDLMKPRQSGPVQSLRQPGYPGGTRGFPPHDYSWFGFIGIDHENAIIVPKGFLWCNLLIPKRILIDWTVQEGLESVFFRHKD